MMRHARKIVFAGLSVITLMVIVILVLAGYNGRAIQQSHEAEVEVGRIRQAYDLISKSVVGILGAHPLSTFSGHLPDSLLQQLDTSFSALKLENDSDLHQAIDSISAYARFILSRHSVAETEGEILPSDSAFRLLEQYTSLEDKFILRLRAAEANARDQHQVVAKYHSIQLLLLALCLPTIVFVAVYSGNALRKGRAVEEENQRLREQKQQLETTMTERARELHLRNEEIMAQNKELREQQEALADRNAALQEAHKTIESQHREIQSLYDNLKAEVDNRTVELRKTNEELIQQNSQLEQFAFIAAHNLRAPLTRVMGLANMIKMSATVEERDEALDKLISSTHETDQVVRDLNAILNIKRRTANLAEVRLVESLDRVKRILAAEISGTGAKVAHNFSEADRVYAIGQYVESVLFNLISNSIKYRDPARTPLIALKTTNQDDYVCLSLMDNGLGIDLKKYGEGLFGLYKRFHLHVEGRGLGLYLVKTQMEALGGRVEVESKPNEGTTFNIFFKRYLI